MKVNRIERPNVMVVWRDIEKYVQRALDASMGEFDLLDILQLILADQMTLWVIEHNGKHIGAGVTQMVYYPRYPAMRMVLMSGDDALRKSWFQPMMEVIENYAILQGAEVFEEVGRPGWEKIGPPMGYKKQYVTMVKQLGTSKLRGAG